MRRPRTPDEPQQRIAVDTSIWLGGLLRGGPAEELIKLAITGKVRLVTSEALIADLVRTVVEGLHFSAKGAAEIVKLVRECAEVIDAPEAKAGTIGANAANAANAPASGVPHGANGAASIAANGIPHGPNGSLNGSADGVADGAVHGAAHPSGRTIHPAAGIPSGADPLLDLAAAGKVGLIATNARPDLLKLGTFEGIPIVTIL